MQDINSEEREREVRERGEDVGAATRVGRREGVG